MSTSANLEPESVPVDVSASRSRWTWLNQGWGWMTVACVLLGVTAGAREYQARQIYQDRSVAAPCPFPLETVPLHLGDWVSDPRHDEKLDDVTVRITGSTDRFIRRYVNQMTGVQVSVLLLYGPAEPVLPHTPEVCFPSGGYRAEGGQSLVPIKTSGKDADFRVATYALDGGVRPIRVRSYYSIRLNDVWSPFAGAGKRFYRSNPGIFKLQAQRELLPNERISAKEPMDELLGLMVSDVETRIQRGRSGAAPVVTASRVTARPGPAD